VSVALLALAAGLIGLGVFLRSGPPLAFAQVAQKFRDAHTLAYQQTVRAPDISKEPVPIQIFQKEPGLVRMEVAGQVTVGYPEQDQYKILSLNPVAKMAIMVVKKRTKQEQQPGQADPMQLVERLRTLVEKEAQAAGTKQIGDVQARGFRVQEGPMEWLVWADPKTRLPIEVEIQLPGDIRTTLSDFRFNPPLDDALFSLEVPKGYKLQPIEVEDLTPEESLVRTLRFFADTSGGKFPKRLDDPFAFVKRLREVRGDKPKEKTSPEDMRSMVNNVRALMFVANLKGKYGYKPDGVKLGDAEKLLFWYRPAGATKYRALYGDLHWADLTTDRLPEIPKL
jgi:outer membrane lipoprotein-sorting protein